MTPTPSGFTVIEFKEHISRSLQGYFALQLPSGMILRGWSFHIQGEKRWINAPAKEYPKNIWTPMIDFADESKRLKFQESAIAAVDAYLEGQR